MTPHPYIDQGSTVSWSRSTTHSKPDLAVSVVGYSDGSVWLFTQTSVAQLPCGSDTLLRDLPKEALKPGGWLGLLLKDFGAIDSARTTINLYGWGDLTVSDFIQRLAEMDRTTRG